MKTNQRRLGRPKGSGSNTPQGTIQSLDRALDVLDALARNSGLTLSDLARELDQSPATMHRVLSTLEARQIVEVSPQTQAWHIGAMAFRLGSAFLRRSGVAERSRPAMRDLMQATKETSNLGIERNGEVMFIGQIETNESIRAFFPPGTMSPMHASGIGKALLSCYSDARLDRFLRDRTLDRFTEKTVFLPTALKEDLQMVRKRGWAFDDEERTSGMRCVAAPIIDVYGETVAGISVSGPTHRMPEGKIDTIGRLVREAALEVSRGLGALQPG